MMVLSCPDEQDGRIDLYDGRGENPKPLHTISALHRKPVHLMAYNDEFDCVVSVDEGGMLEYWRPSGSYDKPENKAEYKPERPHKKTRADVRVVEAVNVSRGEWVEEHDYLSARIACLVLVYGRDKEDDTPHPLENCLENIPWVINCGGGLGERKGYLE